jgi:hypothetical protein
MPSTAFPIEAVETVALHNDTASMSAEEIAELEVEGGNFARGIATALFFEVVAGLAAFSIWHGLHLVR